VANTRRRGFTTYGIVCVAAIVTAHVAVVQPVIKSINEQDKQAKCISNLRQCGIAMQMYWSDWDEALPSSVLAASSPGVPPTQAQVVNFLTAKGSPYPFRGSGRAVTWAQVLSPYLRSPSAAFCPSDTPRTRTSYWWKYAIDLAWRNLSLRYQGDYGYNTDDILLYEHTGWHTGDAAGAKDGVKINVVYMGGRAATVTIRNGPTSYPSASDERTGASAIRLGEPMYYNFDGDTGLRHPGVADYVDPRRYRDSF
jgi:hypothetical protein